MASFCAPCRASRAFSVKRLMSIWRILSFVREGKQGSCLGTFRPAKLDEIVRMSTGEDRRRNWQVGSHFRNDCGRVADQVAVGSDRGTGFGQGHAETA